MNLRLSEEAKLRKLTAEEKDIVGTYERKLGFRTMRYVFRGNGIYLGYTNGIKQNEDFKWSIADNEIHLVRENGHVTVFRLNPDNSISVIANIRNRKRIDIPKEQQIPLKKIN